MNEAYLRRASTSELCDRLWEAVIPAWLGGSAGCVMMVFSAFWRLIMRPWRVLYEGYGGTVWFTHTNGPTFTGTVPPVIPASDTVIPVLIFICGAFLMWLSGHDWRTVRSELVRRRNTSKEE